ncbi:MAG: DEAD/DEAH box helicase [Planctomycetaceae bacterium]
MTTPLFAELPLCREVLRALEAMGHTTPTPIQEQAIPVVLDGADLLGCAQTGTGKTAAFALPILTRLTKGKQATVPKSPRVLVLAPTRELAAQISDSFRSYGKFLRIYQTVVFGGVNQNPQVQALRKGVHILVATPGRLLDLMNQGHIKLDRIDTLVLDEADRMLDMGFMPDIKRIVAELPTERQSLCFSATMPYEVEQLAKSMLKDPQHISVAPESSTTELVDQKLMLVNGDGKRDLLNSVLKGEDVQRVLVFTRTKRRADIVANHLLQADIKADAIHGDKTQRARTMALTHFRAGRTQVLVATDVAARGIDVEGISHVINYDLPQDPESYVHRIGRTGRAKATGIAITFYESSERGKIRAIERVTQVKLLPEGDRGPRREFPEKGSGPRRSGPPRKFDNSTGRKPYKPRSADGATTSSSSGDGDYRSRGGYKGGQGGPQSGGNNEFKPRGGYKGGYKGGQQSSGQNNGPSAGRGEAPSDGRPQRQGSGRPEGYTASGHVPRVHVPRGAAGEGAGRSFDGGPGASNDGDRRYRSPGAAGGKSFGGYKGKKSGGYAGSGEKTGGRTNKSRGAAGGSGPKKHHSSASSFKPRKGPKPAPAGS